MKNKEWFEMKDIRKRWFDNSVWIPIRASRVIEKNETINKVGYLEEFFGAGTLMVFNDKKSDAEKLEWSELGLSQSHRSYIDHEGKYHPSRYCVNNEGVIIGEYLVLVRDGNSAEGSEWLLNDDFVISLGLIREGDVWLSLSEGYREVARISRSVEGASEVLEIKAEFLKDYLCARNMSLRIASYRSRVEIVDDPGELAEWEKTEQIEKTENDRWECCVMPISKNGEPYGAGWSYLHISRTDVDFEEDVPNFGFPNDDVVSMETKTGKMLGEKRYRIFGELWRNEWVNPAGKSTRVGDDEEDELIYFIVNSEGSKECKKTLVDESRWLWFKPDVINNLISYRGGSLSWYTKDTGNVQCSPGYGVHFGINKIGLINVYAKDIALLPVWQQRIWAGFNVGPDGKVSSELLASQMVAKPADTQAPEEFLEEICNALDETFEMKNGNKLFRGNSTKASLIKSTHRFRSLNKSGLLSLAKDLNKIINEDMNTDVLRSLVKHKDAGEMGSIKLLEIYLSNIVGEQKAHHIVGPLFGVYELRISDAHLSDENIETSLILAGVDLKSNPIEQGYQLLKKVVDTLYLIIMEIK